jgi:hypothetical protein
MPYVVTMITGAVMVTVGLSFQPDTTIRCPPPPPPLSTPAYAVSLRLAYLVRCGVGLAVPGPRKRLCGDVQLARSDD